MLYGNNNNIPIPDNYNNFSPQNNYMFTSEQGMGNFQSNNQISSNNKIGNIFIFNN